MTSPPASHRFAFAFACAFPPLYVIALFRDLALFTVYPSLGVVLWGTHHSRDVADPALSFWRRKCTGTAGPQRRRSERLRSASSSPCCPANGLDGYGQSDCGRFRS
jgi:hypothetical protein